ncbi:O-antigen ligase family protein [Cupriavidus pauculus]|uniref:O-antigen ligase family protein n=1 Tax=Cupriavidus pauculus TaxID=82633 RepID=UPI001FD2C87B|nr:O-antigen ligase family protein [Cupriavidus pauculus]
MISSKNRLSTMADVLVFAFPILVLCVPRGAGVFLAGVVLLAILGWRHMRDAWRQHSAVLNPISWAVLLFLAVYVVSKVYHHTPWNVIDNPSRALLAILTCWVMVCVAPNADRLWQGITVALGVALLIVGYQYLVMGNGRPSGWVQPIAFANMVAALALVGFARPGESHRIDALAWLNVACAVLILVMNETRGAMVAMLLTMFPLLLVRYRRFGLKMFVASAVAIVVLLAAGYAVPGSPLARRVDQAVTEASRFVEQDKVETSVGARLKMWQIGMSYFAQHPVMGAGVGQFATVLKASAYCRHQAELVRNADAEDLPEKQVVCVLEHAHNDIVEAAATTGVPGLLAMLGLFLVPAVLFRRALKTCHAATNLRGVSLAAAGLGVVMASLISGLTQVTTAHQANIVFYAGLIGLLLGLAAREARSTALQSNSSDEKVRQAGTSAARVGDLGRVA